ncbi:HAD-IC family P-type ATPase [Adlercreutzia mucosicola]|uniref:HAD-IC family P-type ATPase n=1 Tax=Adlercreutzia mucosicola TaxID=580026 RepID=UPI000A04730A|nr:HAD-IC family P-type ATPase [Adlercreutzia mucosicola]MCR2033928.1 HAD-IC family P-type ATPase [Adlercreutzia mucosicola]
MATEPLATRPDTNPASTDPASAASAEATTASAAATAINAPTGPCKAAPGPSAGPSHDSPLRGLTSAEAQARVAEGLSNADAGVKTRSIGRIVRENLCTLFNFVNVVLAVLVALTGSYKNMLFMLVIVINAIIGIVQEIRSKRMTDRLAIVVASKASVLRDGTFRTMTLADIVRDDIIRLGRGDQVPADCRVVEGGCKADESLLTGEGKLVPKAIGDELLSGSFISAGSVLAQVVRVGAESYAARITAEAKQHKAVNSEIMTSVNGIIKYVSIVIFPLGALLFARQFLGQHIPWDAATLSTVSALVGMIPEGLILLTSTVLAVAVIRLSRRQVLVQQLYCIETLARVDVLCLDKTGTITTGKMEVAKVAVVEDLANGEGPHITGEGAEQGKAAGSSTTSSSATPDAAPTAAPGSDPAAHLSRVLASLAASDRDPNDTAQAIQAYFADTTDLLAPARVIPFSSEAKFSGAVFQDGRAYVMGAAQFVLAGAPSILERIRPQLEALTADNRVLLVAEVGGFAADGAVEGTPAPLGFVCIRDQIRPTAAQTIGYFIEQGVTLKVISGDDPRTVAGIAGKVGIPHADQYVDATTLATDEAIAEAIGRYSVFGRVRPEQKKAFVQALQQQGHTVAMTGDGVNDVLALKASDCSVAMAAGSDAARNVAQLVLVDNDFASMPHVVAEGRRSINNLQRSASLFLVKTLLSTGAATLFVFLPWQYPFEPIQMTLVSAFTIGLPSFVLALEPNHDLVRGHFLRNCITRSIPGAICGLASIVALCAIGYGAIGLAYDQVSTLCVLTVTFIGVLLILRLCIPFNPLRIALLVVAVAGTALGVVLFPHLFDIAPFTGPMTMLFIPTLAIDAVAFQLLYRALVPQVAGMAANTPTVR